MTQDANERTQIFTDKGGRARVGVGLCGNVLGLAVFSKEAEKRAIEARIQVVTEEVFQDIIAPWPKIITENQNLLLVLCFRFQERASREMEHISLSDKGSP